MSNSQDRNTPDTRGFRGSQSQDDYPPASYGLPYPQQGAAYPGTEVAPKNVGVALLLSFFLPGVGSMYAGKTRTGAVILAGYVVSWVLTIVLIGFAGLVGFWVWGLIDAFHAVRNWNETHGIGSNFHVNKAANTDRRGNGSEGQRPVARQPTDPVAVIPVSIYLADEAIHEQTEAAVEQWIDTAGVSIDTRDEPGIGSWFRLMKASLKGATQSPVSREAFLTAAHVADSHITQKQDAYVTATLMQNLGPVLQGLQSTKDAVIRVGALLIVKIDWAVQVHQLTAAQQAILDHRPHLAASPREIISALELPESVAQEPTFPAGPQQSSAAGTGTPPGEAETETGNEERSASAEVDRSRLHR